jgi:hypothetical protein
MAVLADCPPIVKLFQRIVAVMKNVRLPGSEGLVMASRRCEVMLSAIENMFHVQKVDGSRCSHCMLDLRKLPQALCYL